MEFELVEKIPLTADKLAILSDRKNHCTPFEQTIDGIGGHLKGKKGKFVNFTGIEFN